MTTAQPIVKRIFATLLQGGFPVQGPTVTRYDPGGRRLAQGTWLDQDTTAASTAAFPEDRTIWAGACKPKESIPIISSKEDKSGAFLSLLAPFFSFLIIIFVTLPFKMDFLAPPTSETS
jgi:hypothetical protein